MDPDRHRLKPDRPIDPAIQEPEDAYSDAHAQPSEADLKFVAVELGEEAAGGWYRELPDAQIEVLSRAQLQRVPLDAADAETKARETITEILGRRRPGA